MFCKKGDLKNFTKFTGKDLCRSLLFDKVSDLSHATLLKKRLQRRFFPVNITKFLRTAFFTEYLQWLLLEVLCKKLLGEISHYPEENTCDEVIFSQVSDILLTTASA